MVKKKILILTDSVSLPRRIDDSFVKWEETYVYKLKEFYVNYEIIYVAIGGATIKDFRRQVNYYKVIEPEIVILQCGIVDATPRAYGKIEMELIKKIKFYRFTKPTVDFLRKFRAHNYNSPKKFEEILNEIKIGLNPNIFFSLGIIPSSEAYEKKAPGITENINNYNSILKRNTEFVNLSNIPKEGISSDHHHINRKGHRFIYSELKKILYQCGVA